ncbi:MAG: AmmeMemoRadiSam system radical SAM enzyme [Candidatus Omnitrophota bacterium]
MKKEAMLYEKLDNKFVHCFLCNHNCKIADSKFGICGVRQNIAGTLYTLVYNEVITANIDPIEKKPLYHFLPGSQSYSIATIGCNFRCGFCQNWQISQMSKRQNQEFSSMRMSPETVVEQARLDNCASISYTYTEPTIFFEYAYDSAILAKKHGLKNIFVTNGFMTKKAIDTIKPYLDAANVDIKSFNENFYKNICKASLLPVLDSVKYMKQCGIWVEITTLVVPGENDSDEELNNLADFIASVDKDMPWHISRFHPDYKFTNYNSTPPETLRRARDIGKSKGLRFIYLGNILKGNDTSCYNCNRLLVKRDLYNIKELNLQNGSCSYCGVKIKGIWK